MRLLIIIVVASAILVGLLFGRAEFVIAGAILHLVRAIFDLFRLYSNAKLLRVDTTAPERAAGRWPRIAQWGEGAITLTGLVLVIVTQDSDSNGVAVGGWIIWLGAIMCYYISGVIMRVVGGVPLSMGYGGWAIRRDRKGRYRH